MTTPRPPARSAVLLTGAAARAVRSNLFGVTLGVGVALTAMGVVGSSVLIGGIPHITLFGFTFQPHPTFTCWGGAAYPYILAFRAIWLPDEKLRRASRNLRVMVGVAGTIAVVTLIVWNIQGKFSTAQ